MTEMEVSRGIEIITAEIVEIRNSVQRIALTAAVEIGRRLVEAKELLPYGEWGSWLKEKVDFSQRNAQRLMKLFEEYGDKQGSLFGATVEATTLSHLSVSNALKLLAVPEEEREEFAAEHDVEHLSARQMDELMAQLKAAQKDRDEALDNLDDARRERDEAQETADELREKVAELESRPVDVAVQQPDPADIQKAVDAAVKEATSAFTKQKKDLEKKIKEAEKRQKELAAEAEAQKKAATEAEEKLQSQAATANVTDIEKARLEREIEGLKKQLAMSDAATASFRTLFEQAQDILGRMIAAMNAVTDEETRDKLAAATRKMLEMCGQKVGAD